MKDSKILLIGGNGNLGLEIKKSKIFGNIYAPSKKNLNLLNRKKIGKILKNEKFSLIINCASLARMKACERDVNKAIQNNILGTYNLVKEILNYNKNTRKKIKIVHMSSDAVYPSLHGNYSEESIVGPYNVYVWTKLASEFLIKMIDDHIIIRTRFYKKNQINYKYSANDIFTSQVEISNMPKYINYVIKENYNGIINIGGKKRSDFSIYKKINKKLKTFKRKNLIKKLNFNIAKNATLNLKKFNKIKSKYE